MVIFEEEEEGSNPIHNRTQHVQARQTHLF